MIKKSSRSDGFQHKTCRDDEGRIEIHQLKWLKRACNQPSRWHWAKKKNRECCENCGSKKTSMQNTRHKHSSSHDRHYESTEPREGGPSGEENWRMMSLREDHCPQETGWGSHRTTHASRVWGCTWCKLKAGLSTSERLYRKDLERHNLWSH